MARYSKDRGSRSISVGPAIASSSALENSGATPSNPGTTTGAGDEFVYIPGAGQAYQYPLTLTWDIVVGGTGALSALLASLQGSNDGTNWTTADQSNSVTGESRQFPGGPYRIWRIFINTFTVGSGAPVVTGSITM